MRATAAVVSAVKAYLTRGFNGTTVINVCVVGNAKQGEIVPAGKGAETKNVTCTCNYLIYSTSRVLYCYLKIFSGHVLRLHPFSQCLFLTPLQIWLKFTKVECNINFKIICLRAVINCVRVHSTMPKLKKIKKTEIL